MIPLIEEKYKNLGPVCGVDEVGRGPWAGPVVAGAALLDWELLDPALLSQIKDSKKLTAKKRLEISEGLQSSKGVIYGIGEATVQEIDQLNILQASLLAMKRAVEALEKKLKTPLAVALVDGCHVPPLACQAIPLVKGDSLSLSIGAASILAKVYRDQLMSRLSQEYPSYGWERNSGYGTILHQEGLKCQGVSPHHRRSFKPIQQYLIK